VGRLIEVEVEVERNIKKIITAKRGEAGLEIHSTLSFLKLPAVNKENSKLHYKAQQHIIRSDFEH
jgi:hypothetical protein